MKFSERAVTRLENKLRNFAESYGLSLMCETDSRENVTHVRFRDFPHGYDDKYTVVWRDAHNDTIAASNIIEHMSNKYRLMGPIEAYSIKKVHFNDPYTIVLWKDGTKTIVKTQNNEVYDAEKGLAMCISKKALGNKGNYYEVFKEHTDKHPYVGMKPEEYTKAEIAYNRLVNCLHDKKSTKTAMAIAMEEAIGYLGEVLDI